MSVVLSVVQAAAALLLLVPLLIAAVCALRRANRKIDLILQEECGQEASIPEARTPVPAPDVRHATGPSARSTGGSQVR
jgi:hypothetical protein